MKRKSKLNQKNYFYFKKIKKKKLQKTFSYLNKLEKIQNRNFLFYLKHSYFSMFILYKKLLFNFFKKNYLNKKLIIYNKIQKKNFLPLFALKKQSYFHSFVILNFFKNLNFKNYYFYNKKIKNIMKKNLFFFLFSKNDFNIFNNFNDPESEFSKNIIFKSYLDCKEIKIVESINLFFNFNLFINNIKEFYNIIILIIILNILKNK